MNRCRIEGCPNEPKLVSKHSGISYYACKEHEKEVAHISAVEHTKEEMERAEKQYKFLHSEEVSNIKSPKWIKI